MLSTSSQAAVNTTDHLKALRDAVIAFAAVFLTGGLEALITYLQSGTVDLGRFAVLSPVLVPALTYLISLVRRYLADNAR
jgi:cellobiose-specific phosphotransferase system component IIC